MVKTCLAPKKTKQCCLLDEEKNTEVLGVSGNWGPCVLHGLLSLGCQIWHDSGLKTEEIIIRHRHKTTVSEHCRGQTRTL